MIRINLLGGPKPKRGKRPAVSMGGEGSDRSLVLLVALVVAALTIGLNLYFWQYLNREQARIAKETTAASTEGKRLAKVKERVEEAEKQESNYRRRVDVIDQLRAKQSGPVDLLAMIGNTISTTDAVWLVNVKEDGAKINIEGAALSLHAVANLMANLKRSGYFKNVEIKESYQDETVKDMQSFLFTLVCEKQQAAQPQQQPTKS
jgi:Tfp pilus assembly protein PilN